MLSLERLRESISDLAKIERPSEIGEGIKEIFYNVICADQPLYIAFDGDAPIMSPSSADHRHRYLRLFSHKTVAEKYLSKNPDADVREFPPLDVLNVGKYGLLAGCYGFLLNEGDKWICLPIADLLGIFFERIYGDASLFDRDRAAIISFLIELSRNSEFRYGAILSDSGEMTGEVRMIDPDSDLCFEPILPRSLFNVPTDVLHIVTDRGELSVPTSLVQGGLIYYGYKPDPGAPLFPLDFADAPTPPRQLPRDWHPNALSCISLVFPPYKAGCEQSAEGPSPGGSPSDEKEGDRGEDKVRALEEKAKNILSSAKVRIAAAAAIVTSKVKRRDKHGSDAAAEGPGDGGEQAPERGAAKQSPQRETSIEKQGKLRLVIACVACGVLLLACIAGILAAKSIHQYESDLSKFCAYVDAREYGNAYALYQDRDFGSDANGYLSEHLDALVLKYANNEISAEELSASISSLDNFPAIEQDLSMARLVASKLETSKNAYVQGKGSSDVYTRLDLWRQVIDLDAINYAAVQKAVAENAEENILALNEDITYYSTRIRAFAKDRYEVLAYWYPDSDAARAWEETYAKEDLTPLSYYPIEVYDLTVKQGSTGYWSLSISWKNVSVKTIKSICFSVVALDENGQYVTSSDKAGSWVIFDARDTNRYDPNEGPSKDGYGWVNAFYSPFVAVVQLTGVNIEYADGSTSSFTESVDLTNIQS